MKHLGSALPSVFYLRATALFTFFFHYHKTSVNYFRQVMGRKKLSSKRVIGARGLNQDVHLQTLKLYSLDHHLINFANHFEGSLGEI